MPMLFASTNLNGGYWPFKGLLVSLLSHSSILLGTTLLAIMSTPLPPRLTTRPVMIDLRETGDVTLLPILADSEEPDELPVDKPPSPKGFSFPGRQQIRSDVQEPTNRVQTLLQPAIVNPPILEAPLVLPN